MRRNALVRVDSLLWWAQFSAPPIKWYHPQQADDLPTLTVQTNPTTNMPIGPADLANSLAEAPRINSTCGKQTIKTKQPSVYNEESSQVFCWHERPRVREWDTRRDLARDALEWQHLSTPSTSRLVTREKWPSTVKCRQVSAVCSHTWHFLTRWKPLRTCPEKVWKLDFFSQTFFFPILTSIMSSPKLSYLLSLVEMIRNNGF